MLNIKKYANGRFFDTAAKKYIKPEKLAEMIKKGEDIKVTLTKTGKDITEAVVAQFSKKAEAGKETLARKQKKIEVPFLKADKLKNWLSDVVDHKIEQVMDLIKLPSREQVAKLDENIKALNKKIDALKLAQEKGTQKTAKPQKETAENKAAKKTKTEEKTAETKTE